MLPNDNPVTDDVGEDGLATVEVPLITDQLPFPIAGVFPFNVAVAVHNVCVLPAFDIVGLASTLIATVEVDGGQTPLLMAH